MSQRECSGFNWPPLSIAAEEPVSISPEAVSRTGVWYFDITCSDVIAVRFEPVPSRRPIRCFIARCASGDLLSSFATGVGHPARVACPGTTSSRLFPSLRTIDFERSPVSFQSRARGVAHPDSAAVVCRFSPPCRPCAPTPVPLLAVGHPMQPLPDMRRADARRAEIESPAGVALCFQVSVYKVEPSQAVLARNLLAKADAWLSDAYEMVERGP